MKPSRRVLMLVPAFPPGPQCTFRTLKFVKYLPEFGWEPIVLTPRQSAAPDGCSAAPVPPQVQVVRTSRFATPSVRLSRVKQQLQKRRGAAGGAIGAGSAASSAPSSAPSVDSTGPAAPGVQSHIGALLRQALLWGDTPDAMVGWLPQALAHGRRIVRRRDVVAIHASGPSFSVVLAGALLARATGLPFIADFRDIWTLDAGDPIGTVKGGLASTNPPGREKLVRFLEEWCLRCANAVLFTSRATQELYEAHYAFLQGRTHLIYNGIDPDDLAEREQSQLLAPEIELARNAFAHIGTLHPFQWPQVYAFLVAFAQARHAGLLPAATHVAFVGHVTGVKKELEAAIAELHLGDAVSIFGFVPHCDAVAWMQNCGAALLFVGRNPYFRLSKLSELVAAGRPMLAFAAPDSETGREVAAYGGEVVADENAATVPARLAAVWQRGLNTPRGAAHEVIAHPHPLNRRTNAMQLATVLDELVSS